MSRDDDWMLLHGADIEVRRGGIEAIDRGIVDAVTVDGGILWLDFDGTRPRRMYEKSMGVETWIVR